MAAKSVPQYCGQGKGIFAEPDKADGTTAQTGTQYGYGRVPHNAEAPKSGAEKIALRITAVIVPIILLGVALLMFTGNIEVKCEDTALTINATYWTDLEIDYSEIETIEYRKNLDVGVRTSGFGSPKLSMGIFQNDEFGSYTLYSYTGAKEHIILTSGEKTLVIGMSDPKETQAIYDAMLEKVDK